MRWGITQKLTLISASLVFLSVMIVGLLGSYYIWRLTSIVNRLWGMSSSVKTVDDLQLAISKVDLSIMEYLATAKKESIADLEDAFTTAQLRLNAVSEDMFIPQETQKTLKDTLMDFQTLFDLSGEIIRLQLPLDRELSLAKMGEADALIHKIIAEVDVVDELLHRMLHQLKKEGQIITPLAIRVFIFSYLAISIFSIIMSILFSRKIKKANEELAKWSNVLEERVEERTKELKLAQAQLVQSAKMAAVGQLAGGVAHEINNPLTGVLNNVQLIKMELSQNKECSATDFNDLLDVVEESAQRCNRIVRTLLDFSRAGKGPHQPLNLNDTLDKALIIAETEIRIGNIKLLKEYSLNLPEIVGDSNQLQQVFLDIFNNAKWALRDTKVPEIIIKTSLSSDAKFVVVEIFDNGCGIEKENLTRIFEPFFTTKKPGEGTGLGLSICYGIIKEHTGSIEAESEGKDKGATFRISLPVIKKSSA